MASNHTPNYNLSQWEAADKVVHTDFNADNVKIDAALAGLSASLSTLNTALTRKLSRCELIFSQNPGTSPVNGFVLPNPVKDWSEWDLVFMLVSHPDTTPGAVPMELILFPELEYSPEQDIKLPYTTPGLLLVLLPMHRSQRQLSGFMMADRLTPISGQFSYADFNRLKFYAVSASDQLTARYSIYGVS